MNGSPVSFTAPLATAWRHMTRMLFRPFDFGRWVTLGFSAWLATLGESGFSSGFRISDLGDLPRPSAEALRAKLPPMDGRMWLWITALAMLVLLAIGIGVTLTWISSRGRFVFLDNVAGGRAEIRRPWRRYRAPGNSLFVFRLLWGLAGTLLVLALLIGPLVLFIRLRGGQAPGVGPITATVASGLVFTIFFLAAILVEFLLNQCVVPIMHRFEIGAIEAWRRLLPIFFGRPWTFIAFGLFWLLLQGAAGFALMILVLATCCIAGCVLAIPVAGSILTLPIPTLFRGYALEFLRQFIPEIGIESPPPPPAPPPLPDSAEPGRIDTRTNT